MLFENGKQEAGPVEEFQRLGLMLFVAVPFLVLERGPELPSLLFLICRPGRLYQEIFGVVLAGLPVNLLVNLVLKYAIVTEDFDIDALKTEANYEFNQNLS
ncbi:hypothetical protein GH714_036264 [Hevea brasiliensis]|uniref:Uncharacterized protein n=1 Tax=Hevea brasiliensis TaxID=3981 RepID=A0A6A6LLW1_HEVBR|nr:hypothetical protein GH714_036264 [Hevea brasiliensis]